MGWKLEGLQTVAIGGGRVGVPELNKLNAGRYRIGVVDLNSAIVSRHEHPGAALGSVAA